MKQLAVFDIDGTLTDSVSIHHNAFNKSLIQFGFDNYNSNFNTYKHHTDSYIFKTIFESHFEKSIQKNDLQIFEQILNNQINELTKETKINEISGANDFLKELKNDPDFNIIFATGSLLTPAITKLNQAKIEYNENLIITANSIFSRDDLVLKAIEKAKSFYQIENYKQIISFGDGLWDYETAKNIDIDFIGIGNEKLLELNINLFYSDFKKIKINKLTESDFLNKRSLKTL